MTKARANATAEAAKGDIRVGSGTNATSVLGVGTNGQALVANSGATTGLNWATPTDTTKVPLSTVTAKGDLIAATASGAVSNLAVGTNGQVLTAASGQTTGLQWATPVSGSMTLLSTTTLSGTTTTISGISGSYLHLYCAWYSVNLSATDILCANPNGSTSLSGYAGVSGSSFASTGRRLYIAGASANQMLLTNSSNGGSFWIYNYSSTSVGMKTVNIASRYTSGLSADIGEILAGGIFTSSAITSLAFTTLTGTTTFGGGTVLLYGVN